MKRALVGLLLLGAVSSCVEDVLRLDVDLQVTRASSLADVEVQYEYRTDVDDDTVDGSGRPQVDGFVIAEEARTIVFEVFGDGGFGRSATIPLTADAPATVTVPVLLAPDGVVGEISDAPVDLGGDACVASDGDGTLFMMGGSEANQLGYVYDGSFAVRSVGSADAVADPGCAAFDGRVALFGGCGAGVTGDITVVAVDGSVTVIPLDTDFLEEVGDFCGALAVPQGTDAAWVVTSDGVVFSVSAAGVADVVADLGAGVDAVEVISATAFVAIVDNSAQYVEDAGAIDLGPAVALGRRGNDVLVLDGDEIKRVTNKATERERILVGVTGDFTSFALLGDGRFVGIDGPDVVVIDSAQKKTTLPMGRAHRRVVGLSGDTVLLAGGAGAGFDGFSLR